MIRARARCELAWLLRGLAKRCNALADRMQPIDLSGPSNVSALLRPAPIANLGSMYGPNAKFFGTPEFTSKARAIQAIEKARQ